jgi:hypothetical protein
MADSEAGTGPTGPIAEIADRGDDGAHCTGTRLGGKDAPDGASWHGCLRAAAR